MDRPAQAVARLSVRPCPVCLTGGHTEPVVESTVDPERLTDLAFASRKPPELMHHRMVRCRRCDTLYADPAPAAEDLAAAYADAAYDTGEESRYAAETYAQVVRTLMPRLPARGGALDIGAGDGAFMAELLRLGFEDVVGVEPSSAPIATAPPELRPQIVHGVFRRGDFEAGRFRLITVMQTIEHVPDPLAVCTEAAELLMPGGMLLIVCHDRRALVNRLLGRRSPINDLQHLQLFSPRSIEALLEAGGLRPLGLTRLVNRYPLDYWVRLSPIPARDRVVALLDRLGVGGKPVGLRVGNLAAVGQRPMVKTY